MRTRNRVMILLIVALAGSIAAVVAAGQDNSAQSQQQAQRKLSGTRAASCVVRITVDPAIVPLDLATVQGLLYSSGVAGRAARDVLHLDSLDNPWETLIEMEWLNESSPQLSSTGGPGGESSAAYDDEMMRHLRARYGAQYLEGGPAGGADYPGMRSGGNPPDILSPFRPAAAAGQSATIRLSVRLPDSVPPAADEFMATLVENLRGTLLLAYKKYTTDLRDMLEETQREHSAVVEMSEGGMDPATLVIKEQFSTIVDLSILTPEMPIAEAVETLKKSVDPPLSIVVLWNDLMAFASVEPSTPININGTPQMRLGTALDLLVRGFPASDTKPMWRIKGDVIVIGTVMTLGESNESVGQPNVETDVRILAAQRNDLAGKLQDLELSLAGQEARRKAIAKWIVGTQRETHLRLADDQVTKELENLVQLSAENLSNLRKQADAGRASGMDLAQATENLTRARIELAKRREELSKQVGGGQLEQFSSEMGRIAIDKAEKEAQQEILRRQLAQVQQQLARASTFDPEAAQAHMARETLDILARRAAELQLRIANLQQSMVTTIGAN